MPGAVVMGETIIKGRWPLFTAVGAIGFIAQLVTLWVLKDRLGFHYLTATLVATEIAIVLNFCGHRSWTWSDRPAGPVEAIIRFLRFNLSAGAISLAGAALIMPLLVDMAGINYLVANTFTVGICSAANFVSADRVVFTPAVLLPVFIALGGSAAPADAADLQAETIDAFNRYVRITELRMDEELQRKRPFLWVDRLPAADRREAYARLKRGEIVVSRLTTKEGGRTIDSPHGLIHHWVGTIFVPGGAVERAVALMQDYDRYQTVYSPNIRRSRVIGRQGDSFKVYLQLFMKKVISVVLNTEYDVAYSRPSDSTAHVRSYSTRIAEVQNPGTPQEKEAPVGRDGGYLWRFNNYCSIEQRSEGAYVQCESISLSRGIPVGLGWLVGPFVTSIPRESLEFTLGSMRKALVTQ
jgi:putative flippase GtrA